MQQQKLLIKHGIVTCSLQTLSTIIDSQSREMGKYAEHIVLHAPKWNYLNHTHPFVGRKLLGPNYNSKKKRNSI